MSSVVHSTRTIVFYLAISVWTIFWASLIILLVGLFPFRKRHGYFIKTWAIVAVHLCRAICGIRWKVIGQENIPEEPCVIMSNHQSSWETFFIQTLFTPQTQVIKQELLTIPFFGWALGKTKPIAINRKDVRQSLHQVRDQGKSSLSKKVWVLIFPEGTRNPYGKLGKFSRGGAGLAKAAESKVLPLAHNAGAFWSTTTWVKHPGTITVAIGPVIDTTDLSVAETNDRARDWIEGALNQM